MIIKVGDVVNATRPDGTEVQIQVARLKLGPRSEKDLEAPIVGCVGFILPAQQWKDYVELDESFNVVRDKTEQGAKRRLVATA